MAIGSEQAKRPTSFFLRLLKDFGILEASLGRSLASWGRLGASHLGAHLVPSEALLEPSWAKKYSLTAREPGGGVNPSPKGKKEVGRGSSLNHLRPESQRAGGIIVATYPLLDQGVDRLRVLAEPDFASDPVTVLRGLCWGFDVDVLMASLTKWLPSGHLVYHIAEHAFSTLSDKALRGMLHKGAITGCELASRYSSVDPEEIEVLEAMRSAGFVDVESGSFALTQFGVNQVRSSRVLCAPVLVQDIVAADSVPLEDRSSFELIQRLANEG
eukprot:6341338-Pyramimonas_sp.AAC.1